MIWFSKQTPEGIQAGEIFPRDLIMFQNLDALPELFASEDKYKSDLAYTKTVNWQQSIYYIISKTNGLAIVSFFLSVFLKLIQHPFP